MRKCCEMHIISSGGAGGTRATQCPPPGRAESVLLSVELSPGSEPSTGVAQLSVQACMPHCFASDL